MTEKRTSHVFWLIATIICLMLGGFLALIPIICWMCAAGRTRKHNAKLDTIRHRELLAALRH